MPSSKLSVTRSLVALHGGALELETSPGEGTTFALTLPRGSRVQSKGNPVLTRVSARPVSELARASDLESGAENLRLVEMPERSGRKVLVIDDEAINCHVLRQMLEFEGHEVSVAETGEVGLEFLLEER